MIDGFNAVDKHYIYQLMCNVPLPGSVRFDSQIKIHTSTEKYDVSLDKGFKDLLGKEHHQNGAICQGNFKKRFMKRKWTEKRIMFSIMLLLNSKM